MSTGWRWPASHSDLDSHDSALPDCLQWCCAFTYPVEIVEIQNANNNNISLFLLTEVLSYACICVLCSKNRINIVRRRTTVEPIKCNEKPC